MIVTEALLDQHGRARLTRGAPLPEKMVGLARAFLMLNRQEIQFIWRGSPWLAARMERTGVRVRARRPPRSRSGGSSFRPG